MNNLEKNNRDFELDIPFDELVILYKKAKEDIKSLESKIKQLKSSKESLSYYLSNKQLILSDLSYFNQILIIVRKVNLCQSLTVYERNLINTYLKQFEQGLKGKKLISHYLKLNLSLLGCEEWILPLKKELEEALEKDIANKEVIKKKKEQSKLKRRKTKLERLAESLSPEEVKALLALSEEMRVSKEQKTNV